MEFARPDGAAGRIARRLRLKTRYARRDIGA